LCLPRASSLWLLAGPALGPPPGLTR